MTSQISPDDPLGRRLTKTVSAEGGSASGGNGTTTNYLYDGADLIAETDGSGTITATYLFGPRIDEPLEMKRGPTTSSYSADGLGSITHLTNASGTITERYTYDPYGLPTITNASGTVISTSALGNPFLFHRPGVGCGHRPLLLPGPVLQPDDRQVPLCL